MIWARGGHVALAKHTRGDTFVVTCPVCDAVIVESKDERMADSAVRRGRCPACAAHGSNELSTHQGR